MKRLVQPELLDALPPDDRRAIRSRRDLRRINWWMGNHNIMARALQRHARHTPESVMELGAGDGHFLLRVAQKISPRWPGVRATLLDLKETVSAETLAAYAKLNWQAKAVVADVFDWPSTDDACDVVAANLFLHHFDDARLAGLLEKVSRRAKLFVAVEPYRFARPRLAGQLVRFIACNDVTRHDAVVSIRAGFAGREISGLWPDREKWQLVERRTGWFSHLFVAQRQE